MFPKTRPSLHLESSGVPSLARSSESREDPSALCSRVCTQELVDLPLAASAISQHLPRSLLTSQADNSSICSDQRLPARMAIRGEAFEGHSELAKFLCPASAAICSHLGPSHVAAPAAGSHAWGHAVPAGRVRSLGPHPLPHLRLQVASGPETGQLPEPLRAEDLRRVASPLLHTTLLATTNPQCPTGNQLSGNIGETGVQLGHQEHGVGCSPARTVGS